MLGYYVKWRHMACHQVGSRSVLIVNELGCEVTARTHDSCLMFDYVRIINFSYYC